MFKISRHIQKSLKITYSSVSYLNLTVLENGGKKQSSLGKGSSSKGTHNSIFELFYRRKTNTKWKRLTDKEFFIPKGMSQFNNLKNHRSPSQNHWTPDNLSFEGMQDL